MVQHKLTVGNVEILALHDNESALPLKQIFPGVAAADWAPYQQRYPEGFSGTENLRIHFDCYLLRSQGRTILVDTGAGSMPGRMSSARAWLVTAAKGTALPQRRGCPS